MRRSIRERPRFKERPVDPRRPTFSTRPQRADPPQRSACAHRDDALGVEMQRVWDTNHPVYGPRKGWKPRPRDGARVAGCTVCRRMPGDGAGGRGRAWVTTTQAVPDAPWLFDLVARDVTATRPNQRSLSDFTDVATWRGFVSVAFVIDVFARRIVGLRASASLRTDLARDALEQAVYDRCAADPGDRVHHSDRGTQSLAIRSTERLADAGLELSVGSRGDSYDNALAESVIGLFKTEVIRREDRGDARGGRVATLAGSIVPPPVARPDRVRVTGRVSSALL